MASTPASSPYIFHSTWGRSRGGLSLWGEEKPRKNSSDSVCCSSSAASARLFFLGFASRGGEGESAEFVWRFFFLFFCVQQLLGNTAGLDLNVSVDTLSFSSSGSLLLVGSRRCVCTLLYEARTGALLAKFPLTRNRLLDGIFRELNSGFITDAGIHPTAFRLLSSPISLVLVSRLLRNQQNLPFSTSFFANARTDEECWFRPPLFLFSSPLSVDIRNNRPMYASRVQVTSIHTSAVTGV